MPHHGTDIPDFLGVRGAESRWKRCIQCGWLIDLERVQRGSGYGNEVLTALLELVTESNGNPVTDADGDPTYTPSSTLKDITITVGCPFCSSSEF